MQFYSAVSVLLVAVCSSLLQSGTGNLWAVAGQSVIPGKFDVFNHKPVLLRDIKDDQTTSNNKGIFPFANNRAPLHDTPPSKCKCRELNPTSVR